MYCPECGSKIASDANFCEKCGEKIEAEDDDIKFCKYCGEKINANAEICPECGVRLINSFHNNTKKTANSISQGLTSFFKSKYFIISILVIIILILIASAPQIIDSLTPYKDVDSSYISNPVPFEKVRFTAEYMGQTDNYNWGYFMITGDEYNVLKIDGQYVFLINNKNVAGIGNLNKGDVIQVEGKFSDKEKGTQPIDGEYPEGYWFSLDNYEVVS